MWRIALVLILAVASGCVQTSRDVTSSRLLTPDQTSQNQRLEARDTSASLSLTPLGSIRYDDDCLPLISPDGSRLAVRSGGSPPSWAMKCARNGEVLPPVTKIHIYDITETAKIVHTLSGTYLLGKGINSEGFLIEEPRRNGSRRIGLANWSDGKIQWIVDDEYVNAFGDIDENGTIAYSRRLPDEPGFELVIKGQGSQWVLPSKWERSWVDPVLAPDGETIFVFRHGDGILELGWGRFYEDVPLDVTIQTRLLSDRVNPRSQHEVLVGFSGNDASPPGEYPRIVFRHPGIGRIIEWTAQSGIARPFPEGTLAATMLGQDRGVAALNDALKIIELPQLQQASPVEITLMEEMGIPRKLGSKTDEIILLRPRNGRFELTKMTLLNVQ